MYMNPQLRYAQGTLANASDVYLISNIYLNILNMVDLYELEEDYRYISNYIYMCVCMWNSYHKAGAILYAIDRSQLNVLSGTKVERHSKFPVDD